MPEYTSRSSVLARVVTKASQLIDDKRLGFVVRTREAVEEQGELLEGIEGILRFILPPLSSLPLLWFDGVRYRGRFVNDMERDIPLALDPNEDETDSGGGGDCNPVSTRREWEEAEEIVPLLSAIGERYEPLPRVDMLCLLNGLCTDTVG